MTPLRRTALGSTLLGLLVALVMLVAGASPASATIIGPGIGEVMGGLSVGSGSRVQVDDPTDPSSVDDLLNGSQGSQGSAPGGEQITDYRVDYTVRPDGTVTGKETIDYTFPEGERRRGIFVYWPIRIQQSEDAYRLFPLEVTGVSSPTGAPAKFKTQDDGQFLELQIGDPDSYVRGRQQTYVIDYTVKGTFNDFPDHQEFYVNPIATEWTVPIAKGTVTVTAPKAALKVGCSAGARGTNQPDRCTATTDGTTSTFTTTGLAAKEGLSIAGSYPPGTVSDAAPIIRTGSANEGGGIGEALPESVAKTISTGSYGAGVLVPALAALGMGLLVWRRGRDEQYAGLTPGVAPADGAEGTVTRGRVGPTAVRFEPPEGATPGLIGTLIDESADTRDVSATVVDLAVRGFLTIEEVDTGRKSKADWRLRKAENPPTEQLLDYEQEVYDGLFARGDDTLLSELKNHFSTTLSLTQKGMYRAVVDRGWFRRSPEATRNSWMALAFAVAVLGAALLFFAGLASVSIDNAAGAGLPIPSGVVLGAGVVLAGVLIFVLGRKMPARTAVGSAMQAQTLGFKQYLETAEANQIRFEEAQSIFSRYLPYAIVFGCAERWAKVFGEVAAAAEAQGYALDMPTWYLFYGMHPGFGGFGDFGSIATSMDDFATVASGTFTATPGSSGDSAFGGSGGGFGGGGGFSGGGGFGGGGGGSW